jgi:hypothetical protein
MTTTSLRSARTRISPYPCNGCKHAVYTAPAGQTWSLQRDLHQPHVWCSLFGLVALEVSKNTCSGSGIVAAVVPNECPNIQPVLL